MGQSGKSIGGYGVHIHIVLYLHCICIGWDFLLNGHNFTKGSDMIDFCLATDTLEIVLSALITFRSIPSKLHIHVHKYKIIIIWKHIQTLPNHSKSNMALKMIGMLYLLVLMFYHLQCVGGCQCCLAS